MDYLIVAVPKSKNYKVTKDNGIGGKVMWNEDISGSNGIDNHRRKRILTLWRSSFMSRSNIYLYRLI